MDTPIRNLQSLGAGAAAAASGAEPTQAVNPGQLDAVGGFSLRDGQSSDPFAEVLQRLSNAQSADPCDCLAAVAVASVVVVTAVSGEATSADPEALSTTGILPESPAATAPELSDEDDADTAGMFWGLGPIPPWTLTYQEVQSVTNSSTNVDANHPSGQTVLVPSLSETRLSTPLLAMEPTITSSNILPANGLTRTENLAQSTAPAMSPPTMEMVHHGLQASPSPDIATPTIVSALQDGSPKSSIIVPMEFERTSTIRLVEISNASSTAAAAVSQAMTSQQQPLGKVDRNGEALGDDLITELTGSRDHDAAMVSENDSLMRPVINVTSETNINEALAAEEMNRFERPDDGESVHDEVIAAAENGSQSSAPNDASVARDNTIQGTSHAAPVHHTLQPQGGKAVVEPSVLSQVVDALRLAEADPRDPRPKLEVELDPPELGRMSIELRDTTRGVMAKIVVQRESTLPLIENQMDAIRQSLDRAGVGVHQFQVSYQGQNGSQQSGRAFDERGESNHRESNLGRTRATGSVLSGVRTRDSRISDGRSVDLRM